MGLLDEAIREHLELKRRRGGDPADVARAEHEALGPARRGPEPLAAPEAQAGADVTPEPAPAPLASEPLSEELNFDFGAPPPPAEAVPDATAAVQPAVPPPSPRPADPMPRSTPAPESAPAEPEAGLSSEAGQETVAFDVAQAHEAEAPSPDPEQPPPSPEPAGTAEGEEDVLEETPDFLQETPEHDRLWFEQRPPRDFDFDG